MSFKEIYTKWQERLDKLPESEREFVWGRFVEWFDPEENPTTWPEQVDIILSADPILTDDGLAGFMDEYVPEIP